MADDQEGGDKDVAGDKRTSAEPGDKPSAAGSNGAAPAGTQDDLLVGTFSSLY